MIGIIGPSKFQVTENKLNILNEISKILIENKLSIILTPTFNGATEALAKCYKKNQGKRIIGISFKNENHHGYPGLNRNLCNQIIDVETWEDQPKTLIKDSNHLIVLGFSTGTIWELCLPKFYWSDKNKKIFIIKELINEQLPSSLMQELPIEYISVKDLQHRIIS